MAIDEKYDGFSKEDIEYFHWYELSNYLIRDKKGFCTDALVENAPEWCKDILEKQLALKKQRIKW
ncbi:MAG: hypothetical protein RSC10_08985 [Longicatena sp.]